MSASAPAGIANKNIGSVIAVCTIATITGEVVRVVITHPAPTSFIHVPIFETNVAIHKLRNILILRGLHGEVD